MTVIVVIAIIIVALVVIGHFTNKEGSFTDSRDGKKYKTVKIGTQTWMAENLNYNAEGSKCYNDDSANGEKYGRLYKEETAIKACPAEWHLPSKAEWQTLIDFAGGKNIAGKKLKAKSGWSINKDNTTNEFGFSALPGGWGNPGFFNDVGRKGIWWCASDSNSYAAYKLEMYDVSDSVDDYDSIGSLFSVRCLKGSPITIDTRGSFTDSRDGKTYKTVKIGTQTWMAENLNYNAENSKCYGNDPANGDKYGRLYDWKTAMKACPEGWHLPSEEEWDKLNKFIAITSSGEKLKAISGWDDNKGKSGNGTDDYGFSALPGGNCSSDGTFKDIGGKGYWWSSSSKNGGNLAYSLVMWHNSVMFLHGDDDKSSLFSVRCMKD
ncbi:MAG: fibrobacter succinogenes major paralogous domain-containing protein [Fibromonadaceae bacterium]|jgi:uncharacterized protein (TIGR02145 family)|nr:fibrobacter succinogenes major paralogous domain-containing protein [Fibromonadaceae bacterium]